jgi:F-type H+-transporting ATPase subunit delta
MAELDKRYAYALLQLAEESDSLGIIMAQAQFLATTFKGENSALRILTHPLISTDEKNAFIDKAYSENIHPFLLGFMKLAVAKNRETFIFPSLITLVELIKRRNNYTTARVVSAVPLTHEQMGKLKRTLSAKINKNVDLNVIVDSSQIAGISILVDGYFFDTTVKTMLSNMKESFQINTLQRGTD